MAESIQETTIPVEVDMDMQSPEHVQTECVPVFGVDLDEVNRTRPLYGESLAISLHRHRHRITQQLSTHFLFIIACAVHAAATSYIGWMFVRANKPSPEFEPDLDLVITDGVCGGSIVIAFFTTIIAELARGTERACERMRNRGVDTVELKWKMPRLWGTLRGAWQARADAQPLLCLKLPIETQNGYPVVPICRMVGFIMSSLYGPALGFQVQPNGSHLGGMTLVDAFACGAYGTTMTLVILAMAWFWRMLLVRLWEKRMRSML